MATLPAGIEHRVGRRLECHLASGGIEDPDELALDVISAEDL